MKKSRIQYNVELAAEDKSTWLKKYYVVMPRLYPYFYVLRIGPLPNNGREDTRNRGHYSYISLKGW